MDELQLAEFRKQRLQDFADQKFEGSKAALGRALGYRDGAFVGQMLRGERPITEKTVAQIHKLPGGDEWFDVAKANQNGQVPGEILTPSGKKLVRIQLEDNPDYPAIRRVSLKASAGVSGFGVEYLHDDGPPIVFRADWYKQKGFQPEKLIALKVMGESMVPTFYEGDVIVINTMSTTPKDGLIFLVSYEGELTVKRLVRDAGSWWLVSDNPDQRRYVRKICDEHTNIIGEVVYRQTERVY